MALEITTGLNRVKVCRHGPMLYNIHDDVIGRSLEVYGEYCELEVEMFQQLVRPGDVVVEAGANIGALTVPLAQMVGSGGAVFAFEPQRVVYQMLCGNLALNSLFNVHAHAVAVGESEGTLLVPTPLLDQRNNLGGLALEGHQRGEPASMISLDALDLNACRLIKADVEGMEEAVLRGARRLIARHRPFLYLENNPGPRSASLIRSVKELGYRPYWHIAPYFNPRNFFGNGQDVFPELFAHNMICVPEEMGANLVGFQPAEEHQFEGAR